LVINLTTHLISWQLKIIPNRYVIYLPITLLLG
jgi:hypothetical protein